MSGSDAEGEPLVTKGPRARAQGCRPSLVGAAARLRRRLAARRRRPPATTHNERVIYGEVVFQAIAACGAMSFISVFMVRLGAPNWLVGLYTSLPALVTTLAVLPMGSFVQRRRSLVATARWARLIFRAVIGSFALLPWLPPNIAPYALVGARSAVSVPGSAINVSFTTILGKATTAERRPRMLSTRLAINGLVGAAVGLLAGQWLNLAPYPTNYQLLFFSAFLAGLGSFYALSRLRLPEAPQEEIAKRKWAGLRETLRLVNKTPAFRNFAVASLLFRLSMAMPTALYTIFRVRTLGASDAWIGVLLTVQRFLSVFAYFGLGRLLTRPKYRRWLWVSCMGAALYPFSMALAKTPEMLLISAVMGGLFGAGMNVFLTNTLFQVSPEDQRPTFVAANTFLANVTAFVAPMLGTALAEVVSIPLVLMLAAALRALGSLAFWRLGVGAEK